MDEKSIIKAGEIAKEIKRWIKPQIKKGTPLLEIAEKIESTIIEMGASPAFPVNLSINEIAAHYTPTHDDTTLAHGLLKVDFGVHVDGWIADTAFSMDLENSEENKKLIQASKEALNEVEKNISPEKTLGEIGQIIEDKIHSFGYNPISNLSGHSMEQYDLHAGVSVPNINNHSSTKLGEGLYAVEPFATNGNGSVHDGQEGNIYMWIEDKNPRNPLARQVLEFIKDNFGPLPFASRWIVKEFGIRAKLALRQLQNEGILHHFATLVEEKGKLVSQTENTFILKKGKTIITTKED